MCDKENIPNGRQRISSESELEEGLKIFSSKEQLYSIAVFDVLGFSNLVERNGNEVVLNLYNKLLELIDKQKSSFKGEKSFAGRIVPVPVSNDCKSAILVADANGYVNVCHFSDTFIIYVNYLLCGQGTFLATAFNEPYPLLLGEIGTKYDKSFYQNHNIYLSFLQTCMDFFCQAIVAGIPLRGCVSTGYAVMDKYKSIYLGTPLVEAARGEPARNSMGISFGKSFNNYHPIFNNYFIPYLDNIKEGEKSKFLSPMVLDWVRYWRETADFKDYDLIDCINKMKTDTQYSCYYDNAINFVEFSNNNKNWSHELNRDNVEGILDYYERAEEWYKSIK